MSIFNNESNNRINCNNRLRNILLIIILILLIFLFLGINLLLISGNILQRISNNLGLSNNLLSGVGNGTKSIIQKSSEIISQDTKNSIDVINNSIQSIDSVINNINPSDYCPSNKTPSSQLITPSITSPNVQPSLFNQYNFFPTVLKDLIS